jgi:hypothetical protein|nr:MAG TPA: hypothetical protein [Caudoviricetes sp.]
MTQNGIERVSMATFEAQVERSARLIRWLIVGWAVSVVMLGFVIMTVASYEDQVVTTTSEIAQDSQDNGTNVYAGGDYYGDANDPNNYGNEDEEAGDVGE